MEQQKAMADSPDIYRNVIRSLNIIVIITLIDTVIIIVISILIIILLYKAVK